MYLKCRNLRTIIATFFVCLEILCVVSCDNLILHGGCHLVFNLLVYANFTKGYSLVLKTSFVIGILQKPGGSFTIPSCVFGMQIFLPKSGIFGRKLTDCRLKEEGFEIWREQNGTTQHPYFDNGTFPVKYSLGKMFMYDAGDCALNGKPLWSSFVHVCTVQ